MEATKITPVTTPTLANNDGWWSLRNLRGPVDAVLSEIDKAVDVPQHWKGAIAAEISQCCRGMNFLYLDAHFTVEKGKANLHLTIEPDRVLG